MLGSTQKASEIDTAEARRRGLDVATRRSGGGAVAVGPAESVWVDLVIPPDDPLWGDDVAVAAWWVGDLWAEVLTGLGLDGLEVWKGPLQRTTWSSRICFAGLGPGEVHRGRRKVVGVSQRRTRVGALFQTAVLLRWQPQDLIAVMRRPDDDASVTSHLLDVAEGVGLDRADTLWDALQGRLMP